MLLKQLSEQLSRANLTDCQRLFHGRGHHYRGFEHINIDWYAPVVVITLYKQDESNILSDIAKVITDNVPSCESIQVQHRYQTKAPFTLIWGDAVESTQITENALNYHIQLGASQNTGIFLDMANGRRWVFEQAKHKNVLNLFAYTCAFSVAAIAGGADKVVNIDMAKKRLSKRQRKPSFKWP